MPKSIYTKKVNYRKIWLDANGPIPVDEFGRSYEIHHIDGNHENNHIDNLIAVSIQEHYYIHLSQDDYGACFLISRKIQMSPEEKSKLASLNANNQIKNGTHNFLTRPNGTNLQTDRIKNGTHPFQTRSDGGSLAGDMIKNGTHPSQQIYTCPKCNKTGTGLVMLRYHFDNCGKPPTHCKTYLITFPDGRTEIITNMSKFCKLHNLNPGNMSQVAKGKLKQHKGFKCRELVT